MSFEIKVLETDEEVLQVIPMIIEFCKRTNIPVYRSLFEVVQGFRNPTSITIIVKEDEKVTGYLNGIFLTNSEFLGSQVFSTNGQSNVKSYALIEKKLAELGCKRIFMQTELEPSIFEKYGFKFDRYLLIKEIEKEEE
jgi:hypothetical protein